jgi:hypothetical protein
MGGGVGTEVGRGMVLAEWHGELIGTAHVMGAFAVVIMLLGPDAGAAAGGLPRTRLSRALAGLSLAAASIAAFTLVGRVGRPTALSAVVPEHGSLELVGQEIFTHAIVPFELTTALLIVAVVGAIAVARSHPAQKREESPKKGPTERLFHGPLHPRDAGRPLTKESA